MTPDNRASSAERERTWARFALGRHLLGVITEALGRRGVDVLAVKGIVTGETLYADPAERRISDVDVRVSRDQLDAALGACRSEGWRVVAVSRAYRSFVVLMRGMEIDVESTIGPPALTPLGVRDLLGRASRDPRGFWTPELHDHAVLMAVNIFKDKMASARPWSIEDARRIVEVPRFSVPLFVERLRGAKLTAVGWLVADLLSRDRPSSHWNGVREELGGGPRRDLFKTTLPLVLRRLGPESLAARLLARLGSDDPTMWPEALLRAALWEGEHRLPGLDG